MCIVCHLGQFPAGHPFPGRPPPQPSFPPRPQSRGALCLSTLLSLAISLFLLRNGAVWTRLGVGRPAFGGSLPAAGLFSSRSSPRSLPPRVCRSVSGTQKVGLPKSEFLAPATRLWSWFRPSSTLPSNSFAVQHRVLLREKVTFGPFG